LGTKAGVEQELTGHLSKQKLKIVEKGQSPYRGEKGGLEKEKKRLSPGEDPGMFQ